jgi:hypothetical protein
MDHGILLLGGNFNEIFGSDPEGMTKVAVTCKLLDLLISIRHSNGAPPATLHEAANVSIMLSALIILLLHSSNPDINAFNTRFHSDHQAFYLDFDTKKVFFQ